MKRKTSLIIAFLVLTFFIAFNNIKGIDFFSGQSAAQAAPALKLHFLDVGQADCIFVQLPNGQTMLVDAGNNDDASVIISYLNKQKIKKINYLVATHPHEDHIGSMDSIIRSLQVGKIYMPKVTTTTKTFEDLLLAVKAKGLKINTAKAGIVVLDQGNLKINFVAPCGSNYDDLNNWSAVTRIQYGNNSFLLMGDAEVLSEQEILSSGTNIKANVLKVGHHGSSSSTSSSFLKSVKPKYAVISVGTDNKYGHPHKVTLTKLANANVQVYRTDRDGTIIATSDGKNITIKKLGSTIKPRAPNTGNTIAPVIPIAPAPGSKNYIGNKNSKKFHLPSCSTLPAEQNRVYFKTREEAVKAGYVPCKRCKP